MKTRRWIPLQEIFDEYEQAETDRAADGWNARSERTSRETAVPVRERSRAASTRARRRRAR